MGRLLLASKCIRGVVTLFLWSNVTGPLLAKDAAPAPVKVALGTIGQFHKSETSFRDKDAVFVLTWPEGLAPGESTLRPDTVRVEKIHDACLDEDKTQKTGDRVTLEKIGDVPVGEHVVIKGKFRAGTVRRVDAKAIAGCFLDDPPVFAGTSQEWEAKLARMNKSLPKARTCVLALGTEASCQMTATPVAIISTEGGSGYFKYDLKIACAGRTADISGIHKIVWAGDLNGDGGPDVLVDRIFHYAAVRDLALYLSKGSGSSFAWQKEVMFQADGC